MTVVESITNFLKKRGARGATVSEIKVAVWSELDDVALSSIYSNVYRRVVGSKSQYRPLFERFGPSGEPSRYRLLSDSSDSSSENKPVNGKEKKSNRAAGKAV